MSDNVWDQAPPCCTRNCPPYAEMDMVMVLDSSSSVKKHNWATLKTFGKSVINAFEMTGDTTRLAAFRYNNLVDTKTQILLNQHISDKPGFIASYDKILYKGHGTLTGQALRHAKDVILASANGNRPGVKDVVLTITDGRSHDDVFAISNELRQMGVLTYVVGIKPGNGKQLNLTQLNWIAGSSDHLFMANAGFSGLTTSFAAKIGLSICTNPCRTVVAPDCLPARVDPLNGAISCTNANKARSVCTSTCNPGYNLIGPPSTICNFAGNWTQPPAICEVMQCSPIQTDPAHGHVTCTDTNNVGSECTFTCDAGYHLTGQNKTTCGTNTLWSNDPPVCVKIKCHPQQSDPLNGNVTCTDSNNEGSQCDFQCNEGYVRVGAASSTCQDDGNGDSEGAWSATAPTCERITCVPPHQTPVDGIMTCTDTNNYGSKCDFNCTAGHVL
uniref:Uncharacterized protein n=1 Tax=Ciona savignyi TaxID=51511 RepID=H2ZCL8_CIOSA